MTAVNPYDSDLSNGGSLALLRDRRVNAVGAAPDVLLPGDAVTIAFTLAAVAAVLPAVAIIRVKLWEMVDASRPRIAVRQRSYDASSSPVLSCSYVELAAPARVPAFATNSSRWRVALATAGDSTTAPLYLSLAASWTFRGAEAVAQAGMLTLPPLMVPSFFDLDGHVQPRAIVVDVAWLDSTGSPVYSDARMSTASSVTDTANLAYGPPCPVQPPARYLSLPAPWPSSTGGFTARRDGCTEPPAADGSLQALLAASMPPQSAWGPRAYAMPHKCPISRREVATYTHVWTHALDCAGNVTSVSVVAGRVQVRHPWCPLSPARLFDCFDSVACGGPVMRCCYERASNSSLDGNLVQGSPYYTGPLRHDPETDPLRHYLDRSWVWRSNAPGDLALRPPPVPAHSGSLTRPAVASTAGDPRLISFDGAPFDFMAGGIYLLLGVQLRNFSGPPLSNAMPPLDELDFAVYAQFQEFAPSTGPRWSTLYAWAAVARGGEVRYVRPSSTSARCPAPNWDLASLSEDVSQNPVVSGAGTYTVWPSVHGVSVWSSGINIRVFLPRSLLGGRYGRAATWGLVGTYDGWSSNDFVLPDGSLSAVTAADLGWGIERPAVVAWGNAWRARNLSGACNSRALRVLGDDSCLLPQPSSGGATAVNARGVCSIGPDTPLANVSSWQLACYYDVVASGDASIGLSTLQELQAVSLLANLGPLAPTFNEPDPAVLDFAVRWGRKKFTRQFHAEPGQGAGSGATVRYSLVEGPPGLTFDSSAVVHWNPIVLAPIPRVAFPARPTVPLVIRAETIFANGTASGATTDVLVQFVIVGSPFENATAAIRAAAVATPSPSATPAARCVRVQLFSPSALPAPGVTLPAGVFRYGSGLAFSGYRLSAGRELHLLPFAGSASEEDLLPGVSSSEPDEFGGLRSGFYNLSPGLLFAARLQQGAPRKLFVVEGDGSVHRVFTSPDITDPLQPTNVHSMAYFVAQHGQLGGLRVWQISPTDLVSGLTSVSESAPIQLGALGAGSERGPVVPVSRITSCGGRLVFIGHAVGDTSFYMYAVDQAAASDFDNARSYPLSGDMAPLSTDGVGAPLAFPRCIRSGAAAAYVTATGAVAVVEFSTGYVYPVADDTGALRYADAAAIAPVGTGLCFAGSIEGAEASQGRSLLCIDSSTATSEGLQLSPLYKVACNGETVTVPRGVSWMLGYRSTVYAPCFPNSDAAAPTGCAFNTATHTLHVSANSTVPYSSFTAVDDTVYFAGMGEEAGARPELMSTEAIL